MSDATQDPTLDTAVDHEDATEAAQAPEDPTSQPSVSPAMPDGQAEPEAGPEDSDETPAADAQPSEPAVAEEPSPEISPEPAAADDSAAEAATTEPEPAAVAAVAAAGDAPAAKTEDHAADFAAPEDSQNDAAAETVSTPTSDMSAVAQANELDPNANDAPVKQDADAGKEAVAGDGDTHGGTDTPETLVQNPADPVTGKPIDGSGQPKGVVMGGSGSLNRPSQDLEGAFGTCGGDDSSLPNGSGDDDEGEDDSGYDDAQDGYTGAGEDGEDEGEDCDSGGLVDALDAIIDMVEDIKSRLD